MRNVLRIVGRNVGRNVVRDVGCAATFFDFAETSFIISLKEDYFSIITRKILKNGCRQFLKKYFEPKKSDHRDTILTSRFKTLLTEA